jgi:hypothetical protein
MSSGNSLPEKFGPRLLSNQLFTSDPRNGLGSGAIGFSGVDGYDFLGIGGRAATANCGSLITPLLCRNLPVVGTAIRRRASVIG